MLRILRDFWRDDGGWSELPVSMVMVIVGVAAAALVTTVVVVGARNLAVKAKNQVESVSP